MIDTSDDTAVLDDFGLTLTGSKKWLGAYSVGTKIYCIPYDATDVLVIDTSDDTAVLDDFGLTLSA
ncbi:hypothetical protein N9966_00995, partial [bacterium]|nr:hypothetical protein [bacterium]